MLIFGTVDLRNSLKTFAKNNNNKKKKNNEQKHLLVAIIFVVKIKFLGAVVFLWLLTTGTFETFKHKRKKQLVTKYTIILFASLNKTKINKFKIKKQ